MIKRYKWVAKGAMQNWLHVHIFFRSSHDLTFPDKILRRAWEEKWQLKNIKIFLD